MAAPIKPPLTLRSLSSVPGASGTAGAHGGTPLRLRVAPEFSGIVDLAAGDVYRLRLYTLHSRIYVEVIESDGGVLTTILLSPEEMKRLCGIGMVEAQIAEGQS